VAQAGSSALNSNAGPESDHRRLAWAERVGAAVVLVALGWYLARNWNQVEAYAWSFRWSRLLLGSLCVAIAYSLFVVLWRQLLRAFGERLTLADAHRIWYFGNLARYVPGKVFQLAGTAYLARAKGVPGSTTVAASVLAQVFVVGSAVVVAIAALGGGSLPGPTWLPLVILVGLAALVFTPLFDIVQAALIRWRPDTLSAVPSFGTRQRGALAAGYIISWFFFGAGFYLFLSGLTVVAVEDLWPLVGVSAAGYAAGWLAIFAPGGIGVREGVYALLLARFLPPSAAAAAAILSRLWLTAVEIAVAAALATVFGYRDLSAVAASSKQKT
jgi:uncharacterized membrane protein YbhN (UPF0104 family)